MIAASREEHVHSPIARPWFESLIETEESFGVPDVVWAAYVRIVTNRRIFARPLDLDEAFAYMHAVRAQPTYVAMRGGIRYLGLFERACRDGAATGELVPDAQLAALAIEHGAELVSFDRDFARFPGLRWTRPEPS